MSNLNFEIKEIENKLKPHEVYSLFKDEINSIFLDGSRKIANFLYIHL